MELLLIRHGEQRTDQVNPSLSERGRAQAEAIARYLEAEHLDSLWSSPLERARQTAMPIAIGQDLALGVADDLEELGIRDLRSGVTEPSKIDMDRVWRTLSSGADVSEFDMEGFCARAVAGIESVIAQHPGQQVAVVCHGGVINAYLASMLGIARPAWFMPMHGSIHRVAATRDGMRSLMTLNEGNVHRVVPDVGA